MASSALPSSLVSEHTLKCGLKQRMLVTALAHVSTVLACMYQAVPWAFGLTCAGRSALSRPQIYGVCFSEGYCPS